MRLDAAGGTLWEQSLGPKGGPPSRVREPSGSEARAVAALPDGGVVAAGITTEKGAGKKNACVARFDASGTLVWEKTYGSAGNSLAHSIKRRSYLRERMVGESSSVLTFVAALPGAIIAAGAKGDRRSRGWVFRFDGDGKLLWEKPTATDEKRSGSKIAVFPDGGVALAGGLALEKQDDAAKAWVARFDAGANVLWDKIYAVKGRGLSKIIALPDGGFALAGITDRGRFGLYDGWVARLDANGDLVWQETYGGASEDTATSVAVTPDGTLAVSGITSHCLRHVGAARVVIHGAG
jgi:hypothetical protein